MYCQSTMSVPVALSIIEAEYMGIGNAGVDVILTFLGTSNYLDITKLIVSIISVDNQAIPFG